MSTDFSTNCAPNFIQNMSDNLITLGNTNAENKGLECTIAYNNVESRFPNHVFLYQLWLDQHHRFPIKKTCCIQKVNIEIVSIKTTGTN